MPWSAGQVVTALILGLDPGTESPGFAAWSVLHQAIVYAAATPPPWAVDAIVTESGWAHGPMGKTQMWGLGWRAAWQTRDCLDRSPEAAVYTIAPKAWRAALGGLPANAPNPIIVARLRILRYRDVSSAWTDDMVEAAGLAEAGAIVLARNFKKDRKGLTEVKRT